IARGSLVMLILCRSAPAGEVQNCRKILKSKLKNNLKTEVNDRLPCRMGDRIARRRPGTRAEKGDEAVRRRPRSQSTTGADLSRRKELKGAAGADRSRRDGAKVFRLHRDQSGPARAGAGTRRRHR